MRRRLIRARCAELNEERFDLHAHRQRLGFAAVIDCGHELWIAEIWVHPDHRGHGAARALLAAVISRHGRRTLALSAEPFRWSGDAGGLAAGELAGWYARHGFCQAAGTRMVRPPGT